GLSLWQKRRTIASTPTRLLHRFDRDSRAVAHTALPQPAGVPDATDENQDQLTADGSRGQLQQATAAQSRLLSRTNPQSDEDRPSSLTFGLSPNIAFMHERNLSPGDLLEVLSVLHGLAVHIEVLGVDWVFVDDLIELGTKVLHPVIPLCAGPMVAQGFRVNHPGDIAGASAVFELADFLSLVIEDVGAAAEGIDWGCVFREQEI